MLADAIMTEQSGDRRLVLVVGAGRSGTSVTAGVFGHLGFHVPQPEVQANFTNPRGFGEPRWVVDFHAGLMSRRTVGLFDARPAAWQSTTDAAADDDAVRRLHDWLEAQFAEHDRLVVKDPRTSWFLPLWRRCAGDLDATTYFVTTLRHPTEVLRSIRTTDSDRQPDSSRAAWWSNMMLNTERATRGAHRAFLLYDDLLDDWRGQVSRVERVTGLPLLSAADEDAVARVDGLVDPSLRRMAQGWDEVEVPASVRRIADAVWTELVALAREGDGDPSRSARLDELAATYCCLYAEAESIADSSLTFVRRTTAATIAASARPASLAWLKRRLPRRVRTVLRRFRDGMRETGP